MNIEGEWFGFESSWLRLNRCRLSWLQRRSLGNEYRYNEYRGSIYIHWFRFVSSGLKLNRGKEGGNQNRKVGTRESFVFYLCYRHCYSLQKNPKSLKS